MERKTRTRALIRNIFLEEARPLSPQDVLALAENRGKSIGIATIYRNLKAFEEMDWLTQVELPGQAVRYELANLDHHHHFYCNKCNRVFDIAGCTMVRQESLPEGLNGFKVKHHEVTYYGECFNCSPE